MEHERTSSKRRITSANSHLCKQGHVACVVQLMKIKKNNTERKRPVLLRVSTQTSSVYSQSGFGRLTGKAAAVHVFQEGACVSKEPIWSAGANGSKGQGLLSTEVPTMAHSCLQAIAAQEVVELILLECQNCYHPAKLADPEMDRWNEVWN